MMKNRMIGKASAAAAGLAVAASAQADLDIFGMFTFRIEASQGTTFTVTSHTVWTSAAVSWACLDFDTPCELDADADACVDLLSCETNIWAGDQGCEAGTSAYVESEFGALGPTRIEWFGEYQAIGGGSQGCENALCGAGIGLGFQVEFTASGDFMIEPPDCPLYIPGFTPPSVGREVTTNIICLPSGPVASSLIQHGNLAVQSCGSSASVSGGSYYISGFTLIINDQSDDVTGDARFNQDDVDFLSSIAPTTSPTYTDRFDQDGDGDVDGADIAIYQCFVDACLDARRLGDSDCDNDVDCDDLTAVLAQPFAGEDFTGSTYKVGFDADLDGDNDAADRAVMRDVFLAVEPANFILDGDLNFFDYSEWLALYTAQDPRADLNNDGQFDFFDYSAWQGAYNNPNCLP